MDDEDLVYVIRTLLEEKKKLLLILNTFPKDSEKYEKTLKELEKLNPILDEKILMLLVEFEKLKERCESFKKQKENFDKLKNHYEEKKQFGKE